MSLNKQLNLWIAQSESWQAFRDFDLPGEDQAQYPFLSVADDFYITLFCRSFDVLKLKDWSEEQKQDMLALGHGLVIYSLEGKRENFEGVTFHDNMLYAAAMYYLADYPASAMLLARMFQSKDYSYPLDKFIAGFLTRSIPEDNETGQILLNFLSEGDEDQLRKLKNELFLMMSLAEDNPEIYHSTLLAQALLNKFSRDNIWSDLLTQFDNHEHWKPFVKYSLNRSVPVWSFFPSQKRALLAGILNKETVSLQMPTSAGKTAISELVIYHAWKNNSEHRVLFLAPFRSLASELNQSMGRHLRNLGISVKSIYGGHLPTTEEKAAIESVNLLISTPEKMLAVEDGLPDIFRTFDTIICDEGHLLDDPQRGLSYELLLSRLKSHEKPNRRFVFISAIVPNINIINSWLGGSKDTVIESDYRPTRLEYGFIEKTRKGNYNLIINPLSKYPQRYDLLRYLVPNSLKYKKKEKIMSAVSLKSISVAVTLRALPSGAVALFTTEKRGHRGVEDLAEEIIRQVRDHIHVNKPRNYADVQYINYLEEYFNEIFGGDYLLTRLVHEGALFHHGDLPQDVREIIESALREEQVKLVVCNTTLAEGVNLPIRTMILHSTERMASNQRPESISLRNLKNLVGRAGRAGKETKGLIIVPHKRDQDIIQQLIGDKGVEPVNGTLYKLISNITSVLINRKIELTNDILDSQDEQFLQWLDAIDVSIIDLLSEDTNPQDLEQAVRKMLSHTLSHYQATPEEQKTQQNIFRLRADKIRSYIENGTFTEVNRSGTSLRSFQSLTELFDFDNEVWNKTLKSPLDEEWISYLLSNGLLKSKEFQQALEIFNAWTMKKGNELSIADILKAVDLWMNGYWYHEIAEALKTEVFKIIRLINSLLGYNLQNLSSSVIRIKMAKDEDYDPDLTILNWPLFLQFGINSHLKLGLFELGLTDRVAVLHLSRLLSQLQVQSGIEKDLIGALLVYEDTIVETLKNNIPVIAFNKITRILALIKIR